jgi:uncharacterized protein
MYNGFPVRWTASVDGLEGRRTSKFQGNRAEIGMVIEGIITTEDDDGAMHVAPIGPHVNPELTEWTLKPFQTSHTFARLHATGRGVFHVVDDGLLMIEAVLGLANEPSSCPQATYRPECGWILADSVRALPLQVQHWDCSSERAIAQCFAGSWIELRPFWGWNRARNSLLELAVLLSRRHMLEPKVIEEAVAQHQVIIEKTAGPRERRALELVLQALLP